MKACFFSASLALACLALAAPALQSRLADGPRAAKQQQQPNASHGFKQPAVELASVQQLSGNALNQNPPNFDALIKIAAAGDPVAQNNLGFYYAFGKGVPQNYREALKWLAAAASQGFAPAEVNLAVLYEKGWTGKVDLEKAMHWYLAAAEQGDATAQCKTGKHLPLRARRRARRCGSGRVVSQGGRAGKCRSRKQPRRPVPPRLGRRPGLCPGARLVPQGCGTGSC